MAAALEGPQLSPEGRDRARAFLRLYRSASSAFEDRRPDAFVLRLIERIGLRRQQVFATQADTVERLRNIAKLPELADRLHAPRAAGHRRATSPATWPRWPSRGCARRRRPARRPRRRCR